MKSLAIAWKSAWEGVVCSSSGPSGEGWSIDNCPEPDCGSGAVQCSSPEEWRPPPEGVCTGSAKCSLMFEGHPTPSDSEEVWSQSWSWVICPGQMPCCGSDCPLSSTVQGCNEASGKSRQPLWNLLVRNKNRASRSHTEPSELKTGVICDCSGIHMTPGNGENAFPSCSKIGESNGNRKEKFLADDQCFALWAIVWNRLGENSWHHESDRLNDQCYFILYLHDVL